jgi:hypothetical protein
MSTIIDRPAAITASPRPRTSLVGSDCLTDARLLVTDAQPRLTTLLPMSAAAAAWRLGTGSMKRAFAADEQVNHKAGRIADFGGAYVTTTQQHSIRSGPPTRRP